MHIDSGRLVLTSIYGEDGEIVGIRCDQADPYVLIGNTLINEIRAGRGQFAEFDNNTLRIECLTGNVTYRLVEWAPVGDSWIAERVT